MRVGFCTSPRFLDHDTGPHHPERPDRLRAIFAAVREAGMIDSPNPLCDEYLQFDLKDRKYPRLVELEPRNARLQDLLRVHPRRHIDRVRIASESGGMLDSGDTTVCAASYKVALLAAGACLTCVDAVMTGKVDRAFAAVRPPGHHAEPNASMGFCLFSNIAIAARYAQRKYHLKRIGIVDFDVHHGNGTQAVFFTDDSVLFLSLHEDPHVIYPGSGYDWEIGGGKAKGYTVNIPLPPRAGDKAYLWAMEETVVPKLDAFRPELLLISAGFDAHKGDPLADMELSDNGYYRMTRMLAEVADRHCKGRIISALEGGYNLKALGRSVVHHLLALAE